MNTPSFYTAAPEPHRADDALAAYLAFLGERNGADFKRRDDRMAQQFDPGRVHARAPIDGARFNRQYAHADVNALSVNELALLAFVKINAGEAYGVKVVSAARARRRRTTTLASQVEDTVTHEEHYHTRLLLGAAGHFDGLHVTGAWHPAWPLRLLIGSLAHVPPGVFHPLLLASELAGVHAFTWLLHRLDTAFTDEPEVRESMQARLIDILIDEVGHVAFNRIMVGQAGRAVVRPLAWAVANGQRLMTPELQALGYSSSALGRFDRFDFSHLPAEVRARAFFV